MKSIYHALQANVRVLVTEYDFFEKVGVSKGVKMIAHEDFSKK